MNDIPIGAYTFSDSYLRKLKKDELIEHYRTLEKNWFNEIKSSNIQIDNSKKLLKEEYNKTVDDLTANITECFFGMAMSSGLPTEGATWENAIRQVKRIAEQLKGARQNEDFKQKEI